MYAANVCIQVRQLIDISIDQHANANIPSDSNILITILLDRIDWLDDIIIVNSAANALGEG